MEYGMLNILPQRRYEVFNPFESCKASLQLNLIMVFERNLVVGFRWKKNLH